MLDVLGVGALRHVLVRVRLLVLADGVALQQLDDAVDARLWRHVSRRQVIIVLLVGGSRDLRSSHCGMRVASRACAFPSWASVSAPCCAGFEVAELVGVVVGESGARGTFAVGTHHQMSQRKDMETWDESSHCACVSRALRMSLLHMQPSMSVPPLRQQPTSDVVVSVAVAFISQLL